MQGERRCCLRSISLVVKVACKISERASKIPQNLIEELSLSWALGARKPSITVAFLISNALGGLRPDALVSMLTKR
jgi:hypothetical protein